MMATAVRAGGQGWPAGPDAPAAGVRSSDWRIQLALAAGLEASETFRSLVATLAQSDVIVHIEDGRCRALRPDGCTLIAGTGGRMRYLRIRVNTWRPLPELLQLVAHELQHAVEIANAPEIVDEASLDAFYARVGERRLHGVYETENAVRVGDLVRQEYHDSRRAR